MKHAVPLLFIAITVYIIWNLALPIERKHAARFVGHHAIRIFAITMVIVVLLVLAYFIPAANLL